MLLKTKTLIVSDCYSIVFYKKKFEKSNITHKIKWKSCEQAKHKKSFFARKNDYYSHSFDALKNVTEFEKIITINYDKN